MSRRRVKCSILPPNAKIPDVLDGPDGVGELATRLADYLKSLGFTPAGTAASLRPDGRPVRDPDWGSDLGEFIARALPHEIDRDGVPVTVSLKLDTLEVEVDREGEVCCWIYTED